MSTSSTACPHCGRLDYPHTCVGHFVATPTFAYMSDKLRHDLSQTQRQLAIVHDALERLVAHLETNSEAGAPDYAHDALAAVPVSVTADQEQR